MKIRTIATRSLAISAGIGLFSVGVLTSAADVADTPLISPKAMADALHMVMDSDRAVYTRRIVNRLAAKEKVIKASEHFDDDKALVLPAQMFRFGAEMVAKRAKKNPDVNFSYSLQSMWPINKQNAPKTDAEKTGLKYVADNKGKNYYTTETLGGTQYFTAVYADTAVAPVCASCHNDHKDTPRTDFKIGDVMGGVVIRIPLAN
ncbi:MAG: Tll0287-like domain-containing protein [Burkholderiaceae bacterium]